MRFLLPILLFALLSSCTGQGSGSSLLSSRQAPAQLVQADSPFKAALPLEGDFSPRRVPALSSISQPGEAFWDAASVNIAAPNADFAPDGTALAYAIWRFSGTPQDSLGNVSVDLASAAAGAVYWVGLADYSSGRWSWLGGKDDGTDASITVGGASGQYSSPSGYIYVAVAAEGSAAFSVESVGIEYLERYSVSGTVLDMAGKPLAGALVTTNLLDPLSVTSGADGSFSLPGIPAGSWAVMATMDGFEFSPASQMVTVSNADISGVELRGYQKTSGFVISDTDEPNNHIRNFVQASGSGPLQASISVLDDPHDFYGFNVPAEGFYYFQMDAQDSVLFPELTLLVDEFVKADSSDYQIIGGSTFVGYYFQRSGRYYVDVSCEGGGGAYQLSLLPGELRSFRCELIDNGDPGDGDDGLYEELYLARVELDFGSFRTTAMPAGTGTILLQRVPPLAASARPYDALYSFTPEQVDIDLSLGDVNGLDFNFSAAAVEDTMEPNDDQASATPLSLPLDAPVQGWIGGYDLSNNDNYDFFSFEVPEGQHVLARVSFPLNAPADFNSSGYIDLYDAMGDSVSCHDLQANGLELRTYDPLAAGSYALRIFMEGNLMPYELEIYSFEPRFLSATYLLGGNPIDDCRLNYQTAAIAETGAVETSDGLAEVELPFMPGERVYVHHQRFGVAFDPAYEWVEFGDSDIQLAPTLSYSHDSLEPNDALDQAQPLTLPAEVQGSLSLNTDAYDYYLVSLASPGTLLIEIDPDPSFAVLETSITKSPSTGVLLQHQSNSPASFFFRADDAGDYAISIRTATSEDVRYTLKVATDLTPVYSISGALTNGVALDTNSDTAVINHTSGDFVESPFTSYLLGYYPDGDYEIEWQIANRTVTPSGPTLVQINGADEVLDFTASFLDQDGYEPNDSSASASLQTLPISLSASLDGSKPGSNPSYDSNDYYEFVAPSSGPFELTLIPQTGTPHFYSVNLAEGSFANDVSFGKLSPNGSRRMLRWNLVSGETYIIRVQCSDDLLYDLEASYLP